MSSILLPKLFVVVSGLPASGKTTLGRALAAALQLRLIEKDEILERLFECSDDTVSRRVLSRESDAIFQSEACASDGAVLVSFWRVTGMRADSGTPTGWLAGIAGRIAHVH